MSPSSSDAGMHITIQQEEFSYAFLEAMVTVAGYAMHKKPRPIDNAGIDIGVEVPGQLGEMLSPKFDAQVKCTSDLKIIKATAIHFPLEVKNYKRLIHPLTSSPQLLIVVFVPKKPSDWFQVTEDQTILQKCAYWHTLRGEPETRNKDKITVHIPRQNLITPESLQDIMRRIADKKL
jgi:hypothetical protein